MASTQIVGKVAVKVYPETSGFRKDLKDDLERIEDKLKVKVPVGFDLTQVKRELRNVIRELNAHVADSDAYKVRLNVMVLRGQMRQEVRRAAREMSAIAKEYPVKFDAQINGVEAKDLMVTLDVTKEEIRKLRDKIEDGLKDIQVNLNPNVTFAAKKVAQGQLSYLGRSRIVSFIPQVNKVAAARVGTILAALSGARLGNKLLDDLVDLGKNLDKDIPKIAAMSTALLGLTGWALSASANLFSLSSELAQIGPIALALPGILAGVTIALGVFVIAMTDIKKVIPDVVSEWGDLKKTISDNFWQKAAKPLRNLTNVIMPQLTRGLADAATETGAFFAAFGQDLTDRLTGNGALRQMFRDLGRSLKVLTGATKAWANIITILGEQGAKMLPRLSGYVVDISNRFSDFLTKAQKSGELQEWIDNGISKLKDLGRAVYEITRFFGALAKAANAAGGTTLKALGDTFRDAADVVNTPHFQSQLIGTLKAADTMMNNISRISGPAFTKFFDTMATRLQRILPQTGRIIGTALDGILTALTRPAFQAGLQKLFDGIEEMVNRLQPALGPLADALGSILGLAGEMAKAFSPALASIITIVSNAVSTMAPYLEDAVKALSGPLAGVLEAISGPIDKIAKAAGPALADIAKMVGDIVKGLTPDVGRVADHLATFIADTLKGLDKDTLKAVGDGAVAVGRGLFDIANATVELAAVAAGPEGSNVRILLKSLGDTAAQQIGPALHGIASGLRDIASIFKGGGKGGVFSGLVDEITALPTLLKGLAKIVGGVAHFIFQPLIEFSPDGGKLAHRLAGWIRGEFAEFKASVDMKGFWTSLFTFDESWGSLGGKTIGQVFSGMLDSVAEWSNKVTLRVNEAGTQIVNGLKQGCKDTFQGVLDGWTEFGNTLIQGVKDLFGIHSPSTVFAEIGRDIVRGLLQGIGELIGSVVGKFTGLREQLVGYFAGAGSWLVGAGARIVTGLSSGIGSARARVSGVMSGLARTVRNGLPNPGSMLLAAGARIVAGLVAGITSRRAGLMGLLSGIAAGIRARFAGAGSWLTSAGAGLVGGLVRGINGRRGSVQAAARGLLSAARAGTAGSSSTLYGVGVNVAAGLANGMASMLGRVRSIAFSLAAAVRSAVTSRQALDVRSPSRAMYGIGVYVGEGLANGIKDSTRIVQKAVTGMAAVVTDTDFTLGQVKAPTAASGALIRAVSGNVVDQSGHLPAPAAPVTNNFITNNPLPEKPSVSRNKTLRAMKNLEVA